MKRHAYCFGCDGKFGAEDSIASARRSSFAALKRDPEVLRSDLRSIQKFYKLNKKPLGSLYILFIRYSLNIKVTH